MNSITLTASMRSNLMSLKNIAAQMNKTQNILSTGKKVNSAIDNASAYYQARALTNRAGDLSALLDSMGQGIQTIQAATEGLTSATAFLEQATAVANQAASKATNIVARVSTEEELLAAVNSGQEGFIVLENDITMSDNQNIVLKDNQSLVGAKYFDKNAAQNTKLSFNVVDAAQNAIVMANNSMLSDLDINFVSNKKAIDDGVINAIDKDVVLQNLNIDFNIQDNSTKSYSGVVFGGNVKLKGFVNIKDTGDVCNTSTGGLNQANPVFRSSTIEVSDGAVLNIDTKGAWNYGFQGSTLKQLGNSVVNVKTQGYQSIPLIHSKVELYDSAVLNLTNGNYPSLSSILNSDVDMFSSQAKINMHSCFYSSKPWGSNAINLNVAKGAEISTSSGTYKALSDVAIEIPDDPGTIVDDLSAYGFSKDDTKPANYGSVFDNFATYMQNSAKTKAVEAEKMEESKQFSTILSEFDKLINDTSYQGVNLLKGADLTVTFNESRSNKFTVFGRDMSAENLGLATRDWTSKSDVESSIKELTSAVDKIRDFQSELGNNYSIIQTRQNFTEALTDVLEAGADNLVLADMNEASAEYLMLQTRQQLATNSLSLAAQSAQSILWLF